MRSNRFSRRALLHAGSGLALSLPLLEALSPRTARAEGAVFPQRFVVMFSPIGTLPVPWTPTVTSTGFTLSPILAPLKPYQDAERWIEPDEHHAQPRLEDVAPGLLSRFTPTTSRTARRHPRHIRTAARSPQPVLQPPSAATRLRPPTSAAPGARWLG